MCISNYFMLFVYQALPYLVFTEACDDIVCSNVYDPVCGEATALDGQKVTKRFQNVCYLRLLQCHFKYTAFRSGQMSLTLRKYFVTHLDNDTLASRDAELSGLEQIPDERCHIKKVDVSLEPSRRLYDFSIVGAHQACNHTCPTYCLDTYDPACAMIWSSNMQTYTYRPMINHCHIDMFSCVAGVNVTIQPLIGKCYKNPSAINFMFNIASLKTLKLIDEPPSQPLTLQHRSRRVYSYKRNINQLLSKEIKDFVKKLTCKIKTFS